MGKSLSGPDEIDVIAMMMAMGSLHSGRVELSVSPSGNGFVPHATTRCRILFDVLPGSALPAVVEVMEHWPCKDHNSLWAHLYAGLYALDLEISKVYQQEKLWAD